VDEKILKYSAMKAQRYIPLFSSIFRIILLIGFFSSSSLGTWARIELLLYVWLFLGGLLRKAQKSYDALAQIFCFKTAGGLLILLGLAGAPTLVAGLVLRMAIIPFHFWYFQAFPNLRLSLIISGGIILKIFPLVLWEANIYSNLLASVTSIVGSIGIMSSRTFGRLLVSSRISQSGLLIFRLLSSPLLIYLFVYYLAASVACSKNPYSLWNLRALPPIPMFFLKVWILTQVPLLILVLLLWRIAISFYPYLKFTLASLIFLEPEIGTKLLTLSWLMPLGDAMSIFYKP